ncbi:citrate lyase subunit beta / citryl-CoA lyase [Blastococcus fimeti]|nr:citrate lyase subunit beta / citryl-CoA lyase [Blastococcus fimeti]
MTPAPRSYLYVPGDRPDRMATAAGRGADALILDLEDAVPAPAKAAAREHVRTFLAAAPEGPQWWVRINAESVAEDVAAVVGPRLSGIVLPKADPALLAELDRALSSAEAESGVVPRSVPVLALIETARGLVRAEQVAAASRVVRLGLGEADLVGELGLQPGPDREELWPLRSRIVVASAAAGILPPVGPVETAIRDTDRLVRTTALLLRQGFRARTAIHPDQVTVVNEAFTPSTEQLAAARDVLDRLAAAQERSAGVALTADGRFIDEAVARSAREVVGRAR